MTSQQRGNMGETRAIDFLQQLGYTIHKRNYRIRGAEIDIIAQDHDTLVFVEVKLRSALAWVGSLEAVAPAQCRRIYQAAAHYIQQHGWEGACRFDVVALTMSAGGACQIEHIPAAFEVDS